MEVEDTLLKEIDSGLREAIQLKKLLMSGLSREAGDPGLNHTHYRTLMMLADKGPDCMKGIRHHLGLEAGSFTPVVDRLIDKGLIERERDETDRRRILLRITDTGEVTVERLKTIIQNRIRERLSVLDGELIRDLATSMQNIRRVNEILQESEHERKKQN